MKAAVLLLLFAGTSPPDFRGAWKLIGAKGANAPPEFVTTIDQAGDALQFHARWDEPKQGQYALTLLGVVVPEMQFTTADQQDLNQVGPFVFHSRSHWKDGRLITDWNTSAYMEQWFRGTWTRYLSADGREMTVEISALSSGGGRSAATLIFRREPPVPNGGSSPPGGR